MNNSRQWFYLAAMLFSLVFLYFLGDVLVPFLVAALIAYLTNPLTNILVKWRIPRVLAVIFVFIILLVFISIFLLIFIPIFERQVSLLFSKIPQMLDWIQSTLLPWINSRFHVSEKIEMKDFSSMLSENWAQTSDIVKSTLKVVTHSGFAFFAWMTNLLLIPVVLFYLLRDWPKIVSGFHGLLPRTIEPTVTKLVKQCNEVLGAFLRGQLMVMIALGILYSIGLAFVGLDTALVIGMIAGLVSIVPYLGFIVGIASASIAAFFQFHDFWHVFGVALVFIVAQSIEGSFLTPLLVGDKVGVHPVIIIFAILAGGKLFGFVGVLLAIPVTAILMVLLRYFKSQYLKSSLYS
ncbi:MAG: AI-2E family transporter [Legionellales bacterium]|nr:AI-2E family transporter [Legionellales bacterium]|tara:strand:+ start:354 stop:1400 length:1047 start_codon:yes stop_codon:yes gene_type:complete